MLWGCIAFVQGEQIHVTFSFPSCYFSLYCPLLPCISFLILASLNTNINCSFSLCWVASACSTTNLLQEKRAVETLMSVAGLTQQRWSFFCVAWITPHTQAPFQCWNLLLPPLSSLCELQRRLLVAHKWHGSDNDLLMGKDAACPVFISMTPAGRSTTALPARALLMLSPDHSLYPQFALLSLYVVVDAS